MAESKYLYKCNWRCDDKTPLYELGDKSKKKPIVVCKTCSQDEDEDEYVYHFDCSEIFHSKKKNQDHHFYVVDMTKLHNMSKEDIIDKIYKNVTYEDIMKDYMYIAAFGAVYGARGAGFPSIMFAGAGWYAFKYFSGEIDTATFFRSTLRAFGNNLGGFAVQAGAAAGAFFGPVGAIVGGMIGGVFGVGNRIAYDKEEDTQKACLIAEAMLFMDVPPLKMLDQHVVRNHFYRLAIEYYPDKQRDSSEERKGETKTKWMVLCIAKDVLLAYLETEDKLTRYCKKKIMEEYRNNKGKSYSFELLRNLTITGPVTRSRTLELTGGYTKRKPENTEGQRIKTSKKR